jgi:2-iminobutanoate/2-iminopropanoate deaminase
MDKEIISTNQAPKAIGPYSQAVKHGNIIYCSGQIALDHETTEIVGATASVQTKKVMGNLGEVLKAAGSDYSKVLKCTIYMKNLEDFSEVNEIYESFFPASPPARATVEVSRLPKDVLIEIDLIAHV